MKTVRWKHWNNRQQFARSIWKYQPNKRGILKCQAWNIQKLVPREFAPSLPSKKYKIQYPHIQVRIVSHESCDALFIGHSFFHHSSHSLCPSKKPYLIFRVSMRSIVHVAICFLLTKKSIKTTFSFDNSRGGFKKLKRIDRWKTMLKYFKSAAIFGPHKR